MFELEEPIEFSKDIFPACLPSAPKIPRIRETGYKLFGYGRDRKFRFLCDLLKFLIPASDSVLESGKLKSLYSFVAECSDDFPYGGVYCTSAVNRGLSCDVCF